MVTTDGSILAAAAATVPSSTGLWAAGTLVTLIGEATGPRPATRWRTSRRPPRRRSPPPAPPRRPCAPTHAAGRGRRRGGAARRAGASASVTEAGRPPAPGSRSPVAAEPSRSDRKSAGRLRRSAGPKGGVFRSGLLVCVHASKMPRESVSYAVRRLNSLSVSVGISSSARGSDRRRDRPAGRRTDCSAARPDAGGRRRRRPAATTSAGVRAPAASAARTWSSAPAGARGRRPASRAGSVTTGPWPGRISATPRSATSALQPRQRLEVGAQVPVRMGDHRRAAAEHHVPGQQPDDPSVAADQQRPRVAGVTGRRHHRQPSPRAPRPGRRPSSPSGPTRNAGSAARTPQPARAASRGALGMVEVPVGEQDGRRSRRAPPATIASR